VLAQLYERLKNKPAMLRALNWTLASDPATRKQKDLAQASNVTGGAVSPIMNALFEEALRAYQEEYGTSPAVRFKTKEANQAMRKLLASAEKVGRHGKNH
jgi:hypothetical protein